VDKLKGYQKTYLKGLAHHKNPLVFVGQKGISPAVIRSVEETLDTHELIKVKFIDFKQKDQKTKIAREIEMQTASEMVSMVGHVAVFYRQHKDSEKRKIVLPKR
jgi:RNA-binding protein